jgi:hypothetical protein
MNVKNPNDKFLFLLHFLAFHFVHDLNSLHITNIAAANDEASNTGKMQDLKSY